MAEPFKLRYTEKVLADLGTLRKFDQRRVLDAIVLHLSHEPTRVSKSRIKRMVQPFWSQYRLRIDEFRVYYDVDLNARAVNLLRVLTKDTESTQTTQEQSP